MGEVEELITPARRAQQQYVVSHGRDGVRYHPVPDRGGKFVESWNYHNALEYALERGMVGASGGNS